MKYATNLEAAHAIVCEEYARFRKTGGTASSPYAFYLLHQASLRRTLRAKGPRGDFELYEIQFTGIDGQPTIVDLRVLAPDIFGEPPNAA